MRCGLSVGILRRLSVCIAELTADARCLVNYSVRASHCNGYSDNISR